MSLALVMRIIFYATATIIVVGMLWTMTNGVLNLDDLFDTGDKNPLLESGTTVFAPNVKKDYQDQIKSIMIDLKKEKGFGDYCMDIVWIKNKEFKDNIELRFLGGTDKTHIDFLQNQVTEVARDSVPKKLCVIENIKKSSFENCLLGPDNCDLEDIVVSTSSFEWISRFNNVKYVNSQGSLRQGNLVKIQDGNYLKLPVLKTEDFVCLLAINDNGLGARITARISQREGLACDTCAFMGYGQGCSGFDADRELCSDQFCSMGCWEKGEFTLPPIVEYQYISCEECSNMNNCAGYGRDKKSCEENPCNIEGECSFITSRNNPNPTCKDCDTIRCLDFDEADCSLNSCGKSCFNYYGPVGSNWQRCSTCTAINSCNSADYRNPLTCRNDPCFVGPCEVSSTNSCDSCANMGCGDFPDPEICTTNRCGFSCFWDTARTRCIQS